eukprot:scaffold70578_cov34-Tisochrysis_lutea.AAC.1
MGCGTGREGCGRSRRRTSSQPPTPPAPCAAQRPRRPPALPLHTRGASLALPRAGRDGPHGRAPRALAPPHAASPADRSISRQLPVRWAELSLRVSGAGEAALCGAALCGAALRSERALSLAAGSPRSAARAVATERCPEEV